MELENIVATNLTEIRKSKQWTQLELAEKINYSDKTISKWERGDGMPDLKTLCMLAELYGVTVQYFVTENSFDSIKSFQTPKEERGYHICISLLMVLGVWIALTMAYVYILIYRDVNYWPLLVWGVPLSAMIMYIAGKKWLGGKLDTIWLSVFCWTILAAVYLQFLSYNLWAVFFIGIPIQLALILWAFVDAKYRH